MNSTKKQKFLNSPLIRIIFGLLICFAVFILAQQLVGKILDVTTIDKNYRNLIKGIIASSFVAFTYIFFYKKYEKREIGEFSSKGLLKNTILGVLIGTTIQGLTIIVIYFWGNFQIISVNPFSSIITPFAIAFSVAIFEEILLRGIIFRIVEEKLGSYISLAISAIIFGAVHLLNPDSSVISSICIGIVGFVFGASYIYSRSLWLPIAIHFSWNFVQSGIFGAITSGNEKTSSLFNTNISGAELITGGAFGPEGTIQAILFWLLVSIIFMVIITKQNKIIKPFWKN
ncbi:MAG: type II CAAX endopeptidase family protein [Mariniphaga sp.]